MGKIRLVEGLETTTRTRKAGSVAEAGIKTKTLLYPTELMGVYDDITCDKI